MYSPALPGCIMQMIFRYASRLATVLALAFFFVVSPNLSLAQAPNSELPSDCYVLGTSTITMGSLIASTTCQRQNGITPNNRTSHEFPAGTLIGDITGQYNAGTVVNLKCNAPSSCFWGFGTSPSTGLVRQLRISNGYLASPYNTITLKWDGSKFVNYYGYVPSKVPFPVTSLVIDQKTKFTNIVVSGTASSTQFQVDFTVDTTEFSTENRPDIVQFYVTSADSSQVGVRKVTNLPLVTGTSTRTAILTPPHYSGVLYGSSTLPDGNYTVWVNFWNLQSNRLTLPAEITANFTVSAGIVSTYTKVSQSQGLLPTQVATYQECSLGNFTGCIANAFIFTFYPSQDVLSQFTLLNSQMQSKTPFVYVYQTSDLFTKLYTSPETASSSISVDILGGSLTLISVSQLNAIPYTGWLRSVLGYIIYVLFAFWVYRRVLKIFNTNPQ